MQVLSYDQAVLEGFKAQRAATGDIAMFRPQAHAERMHAGAARTCMPAVPEATFMDAVEGTVRANAAWCRRWGLGRCTSGRCSSGRHPGWASGPI